MAIATKGPRKVIVGSTLHNMFVPYPGLERRLDELGRLVDRMSARARRRYRGLSLDIAALPEMAVTGNKTGTAAEVSVPLEGKVLRSMGDAARRNGCYVVVTMHLAEGRNPARYSNAAVLLDRKGEVVGVYRKAHPVPERATGQLEGGVTAGDAYPILETDFGKVGLQICWDMAFDEGWEELSRRGAELVIWPTQWPGRIHPSARALRFGYHILSSTWRNNASLTDPTGHTIAQIRRPGDVLLERIDLEYAILAWQSTLRNGRLFRDRYGPRAGYRYSESEDCGIFWSNDPAKPIGEMLRELDLETKAEEVLRTRAAIAALTKGAQRPVRKTSSRGGRPRGVPSPSARSRS